MDTPSPEITLWEPLLYYRPKLQQSLQSSDPPITSPTTFSSQQGSPSLPKENRTQVPFLPTCSCSLTLLFQRNLIALPLHLLLFHICVSLLFKVSFSKCGLHHSQSPAILFNNMYQYAELAWLVVYYGKTALFLCSLVPLHLFTGRVLPSTTITIKT